MQDIFTASQTTPLSLICRTNLQGQSRIASLTVHAGPVETGSTIAEPVYVWKISARGTMYNTLLFTLPASGSWTHITVENSNVILEDGDYIRIDCANNGTLKSVVCIMRDNIA